MKMYRVMIEDRLGNPIAYKDMTEDELADLVAGKIPRQVDITTDPTIVRIRDPLNPFEDELPNPLPSNSRPS
jgi:hypothetical protein